MEGVAGPRREVAAAGVAHRKELSSRPLPQNEGIQRWCRARQRSRRAWRLICGKRYDHGALSGRSSRWCDLHFPRPPLMSLKSGLRALLAHGPQKCWAFQPNPSRTGGCLRMAMLKAQPLQPKTRAFVEAADHAPATKSLGCRQIAEGGPPLFKF